MAAPNTTRHFRIGQFFTSQRQPMEYTHPDSVGAQSTPHVKLSMSPSPANYSDAIDSSIQALGEFLAEQPPHWGSVAVSPCVWPLSPPCVTGFSSDTAPYHSTARFYPQAVKTLGQYDDHQQINLEPLIPMMACAPTADPHYSKEKRSVQDPLLKPSSPVNSKEKLRTRQRGYEKTYRKKKRVEFKHMRHEWIQLEMKHRRLREQMHSRPFAFEYKETSSKVEALRQLQMEERSLRQDLVSLQSLKAWYDVSIIRLPVDREGAILRTTHEWEIVSDALLGVTTTAPFAPLRLTFSW